MISVYSISAVCVLLFALRLAYRRYVTKDYFPLPPGPKGSYLLGVTSQMLDPSSRPIHKFTNWRQQFGNCDLLYLRTIGRKHIIVNDGKAIQDILEKQGANYAERPSNFLFSIRWGDLNLVAMDKGPRIERVRKIFHHYMTPSAVKKCHDAQALEIRKMTLKLMREEKPTTEIIDYGQFFLTRRQFLGELPSNFVDEDKALDDWMEARPLHPLTPFFDIYPWLQKIPECLPIGNLKTESREFHAKVREQWKYCANIVKQQMEAGKPNDSIVSRMLADDIFTKYGFTEDEGLDIIGAQLGSNMIPAAIMQVFVMAMLYYPDVQKKIHQELDRVVGRHRLPTHADEPQLHYLRATIAEAQRWRVIQPVGEARVAKDEDSWNGQRIPKGTLIWINQEAISKNEALYPDAQTLKPERFLAADGTFSRKNEFNTFGFGKRRCPGDNIATSTLFITVATMLWAVHIRPPPSGELPSDDVDTWENPLNLCIPEHFEASFVPRDENVESLLQDGVSEN